MKRTLLLFLLIPAVTGTLDARAQNRYARETGDTLRYVESTDVNVDVQLPQGPMKVAVELDSDISLTFSNPDTMTAWFESLAVSNQSPMGNLKPNTRSMVGKQYRVWFDSRGHVKTLSTPPIPDELASITDFGRQFDEFFLILPEDELEVGMSWEYDVAHADSVDGGRNAYTKSGTMTVVGDTTVAGIRGLKIVGDLDATVYVSKMDLSMGARVVNEFEGVERNLIVFSPEQGVMLLRDRTADLSGTTELVGGPMPITMEQDISYVSTQRLQP